MSKIPISESRLAAIESRLAALEAARASPSERDHCSPRELADRLGVRVSVILEALRSGALAARDVASHAPGKRPRPHWRIPLSEVDRWLASLPTPPATTAAKSVKREPGKPRRITSSVFGDIEILPDD